MFITNFLYYNALGLITSTIIFIGLEYISEPDIEKLINTFSGYKDTVIFWTLDKIVSLKMLKDNIYESMIKTNVNNRYIVYNKENNYQYVTYKEGSEKDETLYVIENIKLKDNILKKTPNNNNEEIKQSKPYIQIELQIGEQEIDLNSHMKPYLVEGNIINNEFITMLISNHLDIECDLSYYKIKMLDSSFSEVTMDNNSGFIIKSNNSYEII